MRNGARIRAAFVLLLTAGLGACEIPEGASPPGVAAEREQLPNGAELVRYQSLGPEEPELVLPDLRIGTLEGEFEYVFGDVRGIEIGADGTIYVLDNQASEIRAFQPDGTFDRTVARSGSGPGEIGQANGLVRAPDGTLWVQDHSQWRLIRLDPDGGEVERIPMPVLQYGYLWDGVVDEQGRIWTEWSRSVGGPPPGQPPEPGLQEGTSEMHMIALDPETGASDTIYLATATWRSWVVTLDNGWGFRAIPFQPSNLYAVGPSGEIWLAASDRYRIALLDSSGDTVRIVEVDRDPEPVTADDRRAYIEDAAERGENEERAARAMTGAFPDVKPVLAQLVVDDEGRLWVRRPGHGGGHFDVFERSGDFVGSVRLGFESPEYFPPRIRDGALYTLEVDEYDVQSVVRVPVGW